MIAALLVITLLLLVAFVIGVFASNHVREWHHFWIGFVLALLPVVGWLPVWFGWLGVVVMADDVVQHLVQIERPKFVSPLHWLYRHLVFNPVQRWRQR